MHLLRWLTLGWLILGVLGVGMAWWWSRHPPFRDTDRNNRFAMFFGLLLVGLLSLGFSVLVLGWLGYGLWRIAS